MNSPRNWRYFVVAMLSTCTSWCQPMYGLLWTCVTCSTSWWCFFNKVSNKSSERMRADSGICLSWLQTSSASVRRLLRMLYVQCRFDRYYGCFRQQELLLKWHEIRRRSTSMRLHAISCLATGNRSIDQWASHGQLDHQGRYNQRWND